MDEGSRLIYQKERQNKILHNIGLSCSDRLSCHQTLTSKDYSLLVIRDGAYCPLRAHPEPLSIKTPLRLLLILAERLDFVFNLPHVDIEVTVPDPGDDCPLCFMPYKPMCVYTSCPQEIQTPADSLASIFSAGILRFDILYNNLPGTMNCSFCRAAAITKPEGGKARTCAIPLRLYLAVEIYLATDLEDEKMEGLRA